MAPFKIPASYDIFTVFDKGAAALSLMPFTDIFYLMQQPLFDGGEKFAKLTLHRSDNRFMQLLCIDRF